MGWTCEQRHSGCIRSSAVIKAFRTAMVSVRLRGALCVFHIFIAIGCHTPQSSDSALERFEFEEPQMGVPFRIVFYATNSALAEKAADAAFARIAQLNEIMSDYETLSEISILSRTSEEGS